MNDDHLCYFRLWYNKSEEAKSIVIMSFLTVYPNKNNNNKKQETNKDIVLDFYSSV